LQQAFRDGLACWTIYYGKRLLFQALRRFWCGEARLALRALMTLLRYGPYAMYGLWSGKNL
jgi:hypothetical protein